MKNQKNEELLLSPIVKGDLAVNFYENSINLLSENGKMYFIMPMSSGSSEQSKDIRKHILDRDLLEESFSLPDKLFLNTNIPTALYTFNKNKSDKGKNRIFLANGNHEDFIQKNGNKNKFLWKKFLTTIFKSEKVNIDDLENESIAA